MLGFGSARWLGAEHAAGARRIARRRSPRRRLLSRPTSGHAPCRCRATAARARPPRRRSSRPAPPPAAAAPPPVARRPPAAGAASAPADRRPRRSTPRLSARRAGARGARATPDIARRTGGADSTSVPSARSPSEVTGADSARSRADLGRARRQRRGRRWAPLRSAAAPPVTPRARRTCPCPRRPPSRGHPRRSPLGRTRRVPRDLRAGLGGRRSAGCRRSAVRARIRLGAAHEGRDPRRPIDETIITRRRRTAGR